MLIVVLEVKNVPTNHLLVPSSLRIDDTVEKVSTEFVAYHSSATKGKQTDASSEVKNVPTEFDAYQIVRLRKNKDARHSER